jgi:tripartite-type tricarboxylate transporter receptor subunit TctC
MFALIRVLSIVAASSISCLAAAADEVSDFYRGKTVTIIVSNPAGGGYDLLARTIAPTLANHIPGNPSIIVQNMPGAAGMLATNHMFSIAAKDGTVVASISNTVPFEPLLGTAQARFDPLQFNWLGSPTRREAARTAIDPSCLQEPNAVFACPKTPSNAQLNRRPGHWHSPALP